jgi:hypothetical protein
MPDEKYDDVDWLDILWFGTLLKLQNMPLMEISHFMNSMFGSFWSEKYSYLPEARTPRVINHHLLLINLRFILKHLVF